MGDATAGVKLRKLGSASQPAEFAVFDQEADQPSELFGVFWGGASWCWSLLQPETYESFPPVGCDVIRGNGE